MVTCTLSLLGLNSLILFATYFAAHSDTASSSSMMSSLIFTFFFRVQVFWVNALLASETECRRPFLSILPVKKVILHPPKKRKRVKRKAQNLFSSCPKSQVHFLLEKWRAGGYDAACAMNDKAIAVSSRDLLHLDSYYGDENSVRGIGTEEKQKHETNKPYVENFHKHVCLKKHGPYFCYTAVAL